MKVNYVLEPQSWLQQQQKHIFINYCIKTEKLNLVILSSQQPAWFFMCP